jgi:hypothetical protein
VSNDEYGQGGSSNKGGGGGGGKPAPGPAGTQPDYALYGKVMDLPNRGTSYYLMQMTVTDLKTRVQIWTGDYEVKVAR